MKELTLREIQKRIWDNKVKKGFNTTDVSKEFLYLAEELGEAVKAYRKNSKDELAEEIVDLIIYSLGLLEMTKKDGYEEIMKKIEKNEKREYHGKKGGFRQLRDDQKS
ncbi:MAG: MazG nucleotide pyrophosphohydrolase domain-containing protein [Candidatus Pacebacteria bacterium]|nr:MazG nucleotide pyrophosphohydrolase domain-containing protein [Candidatus Paceibacterota bacterium]